MSKYCFLSRYGTEKYVSDYLLYLDASRARINLARNYLTRWSACRSPHISDIALNKDLRDPHETVRNAAADEIKDRAIGNAE